MRLQFNGKMNSSFYMNVFYTNSYNFPFTRFLIHALTFMLFLSIPFSLSHLIITIVAFSFDLFFLVSHFVMVLLLLLPLIVLRKDPLLHQALQSIIQLYTLTVHFAAF